MEINMPKSLEKCLGLGLSVS